MKMKDDTGIRISEFLDGELSDKELDQLMADVKQGDNKQVLNNYARVGHAMRGESDVYSSIDVSQAVAEAIADYEATAENSNVVSQTKSTTWFNANWFKPAMGAAFASVVAIVTVVVNQNAVNVVGPAGIPAVAQQQSIAPDNIELVNFARSSVENQSNMAAREELNNYLVNHARSASGNNYQGMVPYVRAVAYEPGQNKSGRQK